MIKFKEKFKKNDLSSHFPLFFIVLFILIISQYSFSSLESFFYDLRIQYDGWNQSKLDIVIIKIDEDTDLYLGEKNPYSFSTHNVFITNLIKNSPRAILFLAPLDPPEDENEAYRMVDFKRKIKNYIEEEKGIFRFGSSLDNWGERIPPEELKDLGYSLALINTDSAHFSRDDVCRRAILKVSGEDSLHLWTIKKLLGTDEIQFHGENYSYEADASFVNFRYFSNPSINNGQLTVMPYYQIITDNIPKDFLKGKVIIVGTQYDSIPEDFVLSPFNKQDKFSASKLNIHAMILESFYQKKTIGQVPSYLMTTLCLILALFLSIINFRLTPAKGIVMIVLGLIISGIVGYGFFHLGIWIHSVKLMLTFFVVYYIWIPYRAISEYQIRFSMEKETKLFREVDHLKRNFLSLMSHDLKTPLAKIIGKVDNLMNIQNLEPNIKRHLHDILNSTNDLNHFITKILDLTKAESQNFNINKSSRDINKIILEVVEKYKNDIKEKKMEISTDLYPLFPISIDSELMKRVFSNLIENAIKYSGENSTITINSWDENDWIYINVSDSGAGISKEELPRIFEKFYRVKGSSDEVKGSGLGLYLVKYFIELHGGEICVESEIGKGTIFKIKLKNS